MPERPTVLITRPAVGALATELTRQGLAWAHLPLVELVALATPPPAVDPTAVAVVTSAAVAELS